MADIKIFQFSFESPNALVIFDDGIKWNTLELECLNGKVITKVNGIIIDRL